ncbi:MAG: DUF3592 domain-containing protein [Lachnospiraceae bacterium]|nr:DUF3592 domain-containing protein [Lachnospiraceae bacterium]
MTQESGYIGNHNDPSNPAIRICALVFTIIGILFLVIGIFFMSEYRSKAGKYTETEAVITDFDRDGYPYLSYTVDGRTYQAHSNFSSSSMRVGQKIRVFYNPDDPHEIIPAGFNGMFLPLIFLFLGGIFALTGILLLCVLLRKRKKENRQDIFEL